MSNNLTGIGNIDEGILPPEKRIQQLLLSSKVELNTNIAARKYYRSGREMISMADVYTKENNLEQAYILYMRFMTLFLETINEHPDYKNVPIEERNLNYRALREVLPITENIKTKLLEQYSTQYELYQEQKALQEFKEKRDKKLLSIEKNDTPSIQNVNQEQLSTILNNTAVPELNNPTSFELRPPDQNLINLNEFDDNTLPLNIPTHSNSKIQFNQHKPIVDRSTKPMLNKNTTNPYNLRQIIVPGNLTKRFLEQAQRNTFNNLETCGILAGKLNSNCLIVTHLMIPKQSGTSDSCTTMNEEDIFEFQDKQDLITLGWIHTHPTQTSFMSSVDLHTHYSYQLMMPEAIAIVCAPKYNESNFFFLTPYHGLQVIAECKFVSGFHTHNTDGDIYAIAEHYLLDDNLLVNVVDFR
ncbi:STAM-binding protein [Melanaphis sacchari]|uniref:STAM-binding protein n=1 Tax=Melanaphis sacchari TaxID=742174 RepID=A0A2H8TCN6_9HEMI|nr:STAM-binding protein [Melanaphis sacchari]XP_025195792.1 STAM-binding protein [Melanaphis sacchari]XP_025195793.1 STAM-binding protein [Melanaphis sacchari]XP_025195794.1 STAM-binding protein [Melanaphis sacchari]